RAVVVESKSPPSRQHRENGGASAELFGSRRGCKIESLMMNKMVVANLVHRPIRSLISIVAIALEVTLILLIVGLCYGIMNDNKNRTAGIGADVIVQTPGSSLLAAVRWETV